VSLLVTSILVAGGVLLGRWIAKGGRRDGGPEDDEEEGEVEPKKDAAPKEPPPPIKPDKPATRVPPDALFADMPCKLGDVVIRTVGDEAWLAGAVAFREQHLVSALFVAPEAGKDRAIYARPRPNAQVLWLEAIDPGDVVLGAEPPTSIEHAGVRYERARRLPVHVDRYGSGAPDLGEQVIVAEYTSQGFERLLVVTGGGTARAWAGTALEDGMYDVLPSGRSTLDDD
jgi:hypothetical protein